MRQSQKGFTLVELLVALFIFALLSVMAYSGLNSILRVRDRVTAEKQHWRELSVFFKRFEQDMQLVINRPVRNAAGAMEAGLLYQPAGSGNQLSFTRTSVSGYSGVSSGLQRFGYLYQDQKISQLVWPVLDAAPGTEPQATVLLTGVSSLALSFLDSNGQWQTQWPLGTGAPGNGQPGVSPALPVAVKMTLQMTSGEKIDRFFLVGR